MKLPLPNLPVCDILRSEINWFIHVVCVSVMAPASVVGH